MSIDELKWLLPIVSAGEARTLQEMAIKGALLSRFASDLESQVAKAGTPPTTGSNPASPSAISEA